MSDVAAPIAVIIPAHQAARFVADAIDSVLAQDVAIAQIVVVDDGSTDGIADVVRGYGRRVELLSQEQSGAGAARAAGLNATDAPLIAFLDADDIWLPHAARVLAAAVEAEPDALFAYGALETFHDEAVEAGAIGVLGEGPTMIATACLIRRTAFDVVGPFTSGNVSMVEWFARAVESGRPTVPVGTVVARRRLHDANTSSWDPTVRASFAADHQGVARSSPRGLGGTTMTAGIPTPVQTALLQACLLNGELGQEALVRLRSMSDLDSLDEGSHRLLPLLYRSLVDSGRTDPDLGRLRGIHRRAWYANLLLRKQAEGILELLHAHGIDTVLMKGSGLLATVYRHESALRPLDDVDVLVANDHAARAVAVLVDAGYRRSPGQVYGPDAWWRYGHATSYYRGVAESVDIHRRPLRVQLDPGYTERCWSRRVPVQFGEVATTTLDPTDHLLTAILHGVAANPIPPCRWAADATFLIRDESIDWDRLCADAIALGRARTMSTGLGYLVAELQLEVPERTLRGVREAQVTGRVRLLEQLETGPAKRSVILARAVLGDYLVQTAGGGLGPALVGYPAYVRARSYRGLRGTVGRVVSILRRGPVPT